MRGKIAGFVAGLSLLVAPSDALTIRFTEVRLTAPNDDHRIVAVGYAPDGTRLVIDYSGKEYPCIVVDHTCRTNIPTDDPQAKWFMKRVEAPIGAAFIAATEPDIQVSSLRRMVNRLFGR